MNRKRLPVLLSLCLAALILLSACAVSENRGISQQEAVSSVSSFVENKPSLPALSLPKKPENSYSLNVLILYGGKEKNGAWKDTLHALQQSTQMNLTVSSAKAEGQYTLKAYDIVFPDSSVMQAENAAAVSKALVKYVSGGGSVLLTNDFYGYFEKAFIGASEFVPVTECPVNSSAPELGEDLGELQEVISDFTGLYQAFADYDRLSQLDYGYAVVPDTAVPLISWEDNALYTMNRYGKGTVFFTNPLLPNQYCLSGFSMERREDTQTAFSGTAASCNQLLLSSFASYVAKQKYGYALERVFGSFGSPNMAWQLHYEEITGNPNNSLISFGELCKQYLQVPSYALVRSSYNWFFRGESVTYLLGQKGAGLNFAVDFQESAYSSGMHISAGDKWLSLGGIENKESYFSECPQYTYRAYPYFTDYNEDGVTDIFCGSYDGGFYYYQGQQFAERLSTAQAVSLTDLQGNPLRVSGYSAPLLYDLNGDGHPDLISGCEDGNVYWFSGNGTLAFQPEGLLIQTDITGQSMPALGNMNADTIPDIAVGSNKGILQIFYGTEEKPGERPVYSGRQMKDLSALCAAAELGEWLAPEIYDYNDDTIPDMAVGTSDGYIALFCADKSGELRFDCYLTAEEMNYKGNHNIKFANNCVPKFYDLDGDGVMDIACGSLEYGLAYPIDSAYFPYREQLQRQIDYAAANGFYMGVHFYTNAYASPEREAFELEAQKSAFETYGIKIGITGANQHTWYTSTLSDAQSFRSIWQAGLLWDSGFAPAGASYKAPQKAAETVLSQPFYLMDKEEKTLLMQNCSVLPHVDTAWSDITAKYDLPVSVFYHCEFIYESDREARTKLQVLSEFQREKGYNFVMENQMMLATAAAYNTKLYVTESTPFVFGKGKLLLKTEGISRDFPLYHADYQKASGVKINFSEAVDVHGVSTDADVWYRKGNSLYVGLNKAVSIYTAEAAQEQVSHIERINIPAKVVSADTGATIKFLDGGMMQVWVSGAAETADKGWVTTVQHGKTVFTKYGEAETLKIAFTK